MVQSADIYLPAARGTYPVVLLVSGGSVNDWRTSAFYTSFARVLAAEGLAAVSYVKRLERDRSAVPVARVALAKNAPVTLINSPAGDHAFEILNDTDETRRVIAWVKSCLTRL